MKLILITSFVFIVKLGVFSQALVKNNTIDSLEVITVDELTDRDKILKFKCRVDSQMCIDLHYEIRNMKRQSWFLNVLDTVIDCNVAFNKLNKNDKMSFKYYVKNLKYKNFINIKNKFFCKYLTPQQM